MYSSHSCWSGVLPVLTQRSKHILQVLWLAAVSASSLAFRGTLHLAQMNGKLSTIVLICHANFGFGIDLFDHRVQRDWRGAIQMVVVPRLLERLIDGWADVL